jgi:hypothetical protein
MVARPTGTVRCLRRLPTMVKVQTARVGRAGSGNGSSNDGCAAVDEGFVEVLPRIRWPAMPRRSMSGARRNPPLDADLHAVPKPLRHGAVRNRPSIRLPRARFATGARPLHSMECCRSGPNRRRSNECHHNDHQGPRAPAPIVLPAARAEPARNSVRVARRRFSQASARSGSTSRCQDIR